MLSSIFEKITIDRNKTVDNMIWGEIHKIATENGIDTNIILNEKAIVSILKKQIPQKPTHLDSVPHYRCPCCNDAVKLYEDSPTYPIRYCNWCGQALDWSETEKGGAE